MNPPPPESRAGDEPPGHDGRHLARLRAVDAGRAAALEGAGHLLALVRQGAVQPQEERQRQCAEEAGGYKCPGYGSH